MLFSPLGVSTITRHLKICLVVLLLSLDNLDSSRFVTCIVHVSDLAQVLVLGPHQFVGTERVPRLVPWVRSCIAWGKAVRGSVGFYAVSNPSKSFHNGVFIFGNLHSKPFMAPIRPTIGN
jgi:hypothetical protein